MKKQITLLMLIAISVASFAQDAKEIMQKSYSKCQSIKNGYYEEIRIYKFLDGSNNTVFPNGDTSTCYFKKLENNKHFASAFHLNEFKDGYVFGGIYTGDELINYHSEEKKANIYQEKYNADEIGDRKDGYRTYFMLTDIAQSPFPYILDKKNRVYTFKYIAEEKINGYDCYHVQIKRVPTDSLDDDESILFEENNFWINKKDMIPVQFSNESITIFQVEIEGKVMDTTIHQFVKYVLTKYEIDNLKDDSKLKVTAIPSNYKIKSVITYNNPELSTKDTIVPGFNLVSTTDKKVSLSDFKGQLVLVDFFYKSCYPCLQAMPALQKLHEKYKDKGLNIIGIDPVDTKEDNITKFITEHGIGYTILYGDKNTAKDYHVSYYPTMYLINKNGKIIYSEVGYKKGMEAELEEIIKKNL